METQILKKQIDEIDEHTAEAIKNLQEGTVRDFKLSQETFLTSEKNTKIEIQNFRNKVQEGFDIHTEQLSETEEEMQRTKITNDQLIKNQNTNQDKLNEMTKNLEELLTWKHEMTKQKVE